MIGGFGVGGQSFYAYRYGVVVIIYQSSIIIELINYIKIVQRKV